MVANGWYWFTMEGNLLANNGWPLFFHTLLIRSSWVHIRDAADFLRRRGTPGECRRLGAAGQGDFGTMVGHESVGNAMRGL